MAVSLCVVCCLALFVKNSDLTFELPRNILSHFYFFLHKGKNINLSNQKEIHLYRIKKLPTDFLNDKFQDFVVDFLRIVTLNALSPSRFLSYKFQTQTNE